MTARWVAAADRAKLAKDGRAVVRIEGKQIALFDTPQGIFACNNRCPHEGYPLREGSLDDQCRLTCNWHNWKFRLADGSIQGVLDRGNGRLQTGDYDKLLRLVINGTDRELLRHFILTVGVVSNHGN